MTEPADQAHAAPPISPGLQALLDALAVFDNSNAAMASAIGVSASAPGMWKARGRVPAEHCPTIERETKRRGKPVLCERLRSDVDWAVLRMQSGAAEPAAERA